MRRWKNIIRLQHSKGEHTSSCFKVALKHYGLNNVEKIKNSEKIKWVYLKDNPFSISQIAFKGYDDPKEIMDYINQYVNHSKLFEKALKKKINMFYDSMGWVLVDKKNTLDRFF